MHFIFQEGIYPYVKFAELVTMYRIIVMFILLFVQIGYSDTMLHYKDKKLIQMLDEISRLKKMRDVVKVYSALKMNPMFYDEVMGLFKKYQFSENTVFSSVRLEKNRVLVDDQFTGIIIGNETDLTVYIDGIKLAFDEKKDLLHNLNKILIFFRNTKRHSFIYRFLFPSAYADDAVGVGIENAELIKEVGVTGAMAILFSRGLSRMQESLPVKQKESAKSNDEGLLYWQELGELSYKCESGKLKIMMNSKSSNSQRLVIEEYIFEQDGDKVRIQKYLSGVMDDGVPIASDTVLKAEVDGKKYVLHKTVDKRWAELDLKKIYQGIYKMFANCVNGEKDKLISHQYDDLVKQYNQLIKAGGSSEKTLLLKKTIPGMSIK